MPFGGLLYSCHKSFHCQVGSLDSFPFTSVLYLVSFDLSFKPRVYSLLLFNFRTLWLLYFCSLFSHWIFVSFHPLTEVLRIWDFLLADANRFDFLICVCCSMLSLLKVDLMSGDFACNMKLLQNFPDRIDVRTVISKAKSYIPAMPNCTSNG